MSTRIRAAARATTAAIVSSLCLASATALIAANTVTTTPVPDGGQPVRAEIDPRGTVHLLFNSADGPRYARSSDDGRTFGKAIPVVDPQSRRPGLKFTAWDMAIGQGGSVHVALGTNAWKLRLPKEEWALMYARLDPDAPAFSPVQNINHKPSEGFSLAADDKGRVTACWLSGKLYANVSRDDGKTFEPAVEIDPLIDPCDCCTTSAVYRADGTLAVLYREETNNQRDMYLALWDQDRNAVSRTRVSSTLWTIDACPMSYFAIARVGDGFTAVWPTKGEVYFARLDGAGAPRSPAEIKTAGTTGMRTGMLALVAENGDALVAWKKDGQLSWQLFDGAGRSLGAVDSTKSAGSGVAGVVNKKGDFLLFR